MKKFLVLSTVIISFFVIRLSAQSDDFIHQVFMPKEVFVGDSAIIEYSFRDAIDFFIISDPNRITDNILTLDVTRLAFKENTDDCTITSAILKRDGMNYTLTVTFVPWVSGVIDFSPLDLNKSIRPLSDTTNGDEFIIDLAPVTISSILEKRSTTELQKSAPPMTAEGTSYFLLIAIILLVASITGLIFFFIRFPIVLSSIKVSLTNIALHRNAKIALKEIKKILKMKDDKQAAEYWQVVIRRYLSFRFGVSLESVTGSHINKILLGDSADLMPDDYIKCIEDISALFIRTDYIRFAGGSIDSELLPVEEHQAILTNEEKTKIISITDECIKMLERRYEEKADEIQEELEEINVEDGNTK